MPLSAAATGIKNARRNLQYAQTSGASKTKLRPLEEKLKDLLAERDRAGFRFEGADGRSYADKSGAEIPRALTQSEVSSRHRTKTVRALKPGKVQNNLAPDWTSIVRAHPGACKAITGSGDDEVVVADLEVRPLSTRLLSLKLCVCSSSFLDTPGAVFLTSWRWRTRSPSLSESSRPASR